MENRKVRDGKKESKGWIKGKYGMENKKVQDGKKESMGWNTENQESTG